MKQTSIEWLDRWFRDNPEATHEEGNKALQQAKQMHKEEVENAWNYGFTDYQILMHENAEQYYQETYGGNK